MSDKKKLILWFDSGDEGLNLAVTFSLELTGYDVVSYSIPEVRSEIQTVERIANDFKPSLVIAKREVFSDDGHKFCQMMRNNQHTANIAILFIFTRIINWDRETAQKLCWPDDMMQSPIDIREFQTRVGKLIDKYEVN